MNQTEILRFMTQLQHPFFDGIAAVLTFLGNEEFYFLVIPLVYWCFSKKAGFRLFYIFLLSVTVNSFLKITYAIQRPIGVEGVHSLFISSAEVGSHYPYDSFPSGHAQGSATLWGYLAYLIARPSFWVFSIVLVLFISLSRLYSGLHWPTDVVVGMILAVIILMLAIYLQSKLSKLSKKVKWMLAIGVPFVIIAIFPEEEGIKYAGFLLGAGLGYLLETKKVKMIISGAIIRKILAYGIGIIGLFALQIGLKMIFPEALLFDFVRYAFIGLWGLLGAPYLFVLLKLYKSEQNITTSKGNVSV
ncbi:phosphatase PAP2 family protein [Halalkalibacter akibai]|uniref:Phosphatidic acid phosphatase type 2/haloperoxidase domain-containing protein n=1 Tax=Halalkalibacter akibai (strain ATCC 43226 / DSM 21942 / CIP 109018 / JCM 9157 / 1139) TaxID=1236973 RepID=W4QRJ9_HALA3|nr:phosphatase PAP2 family protein [Halalkalibacter akibai]GAE34726.1 hypothetical protein JCM9157_1803 [Halalkalibacter akibai JCM 9157]